MSSHLHHPDTPGTPPPLSCRVFRPAYRPGRGRRVELAAVLGFACLAASAGAHTAAPRGAILLGAAAINHAPGYLGIEFHDAPDDGGAGLHTRTARGVEVVMVDHDGPAGKAGLQSHDIITTMNGQAIAGADALRRMIHDAGSGVQIVLQVMRGGKPMTLSAQLADRDQVARAAMARLAAQTSPDPSPPPPAMETADLGANFLEGRSTADASATVQPAGPVHGSGLSHSQGFPHSQGFLSSMLHGPFTGIVMETMEPQLASFFGVPQGMGLLVHSVAENSPAAQCGLRAGDVVLRADMYTLRTQADWTRRLHAAKGGPMNLAVLRERREFTVTLQPDLKHHSLLEWPLHVG